MRKFKYDVAISILFSIIKIGIALYFIKYAELVLSPLVLGVFLFGRRLASILANIFQLGVSQSLIRFLTTLPEQKEKGRIVYSAIFLVTCSVLFLFLASILFKTKIAVYFFSEYKNNTKLVLSLLIYVVSLLLYYLNYAWLISERRILLLNFVDLCTTNGLLLLGLMLYKMEIIKVFLFHSVAVVAFLVPLLFFFLRRFSIKDSLFQVKIAMRTLINYGVPRTSITFLDDFFLFVGTLFLKDSPASVSYFLIALTLIKLIPLAFQPLIKLSSTITGQLLAKKNTTQFDLGVNVLFSCIVYGSVIISIFGYFWTPRIIGLWLSNETTIQLTSIVTKILLFSTTPFSLFHCFKGIVEIKYYKPMNLYNLLLALLIQVSLIYILKIWYSSLIAVSISVTCSLFFLGVFTFYLIREHLSYSRIRLDLVFLISVIVILFNRFYIDSYSIKNLFVSISVMSILTIIVYLKFNIPILEDLRKILR